MEPIDGIEKTVGCSNRSYNDNREDEDHSSTASLSINSLDSSSPSPTRKTRSLESPANSLSIVQPLTLTHNDYTGDARVMHRSEAWPDCACYTTGHLPTNPLESINAMYFRIRKLLSSIGRQRKVSSTGESSDLDIAAAAENSNSLRIYSIFTVRSSSAQITMAIECPQIPNSELDVVQPLTIGASQLDHGVSTLPNNEMAYGPPNELNKLLMQEETAKRPEQLYRSSRRNAVSVPWRRKVWPLFPSASINTLNLLGKQHKVLLVYEPVYTETESAENRSHSLSTTHRLFTVLSGSAKNTTAISSSGHLPVNRDLNRTPPVILGNNSQTVGSSTPPNIEVVCESPSDESAEASEPTNSRMDDSLFSQHCLPVTPKDSFEDDSDIPSTNGACEGQTRMVECGELIAFVSRTPYYDLTSCFLRASISGFDGEVFNTSGHLIMQCNLK